MYQNHQLSDWISFNLALELRFGLSTYVNHQVELFKLRQSTVKDYQKSFQNLYNRILGLTPDMILNCFILILVPKIQWELAILQPTSILFVLVMSFKVCAIVYFFILLLLDIINLFIVFFYFSNLV